MALSAASSAMGRSTVRSCTLLSALFRSRLRSAPHPFVELGHKVGSSSSYLSQDELTQHFGLGDHAIVESLRIVWPDGEQEADKDVRADQALVYTREPTAPL